MSLFRKKPVVIEAIPVHLVLSTFQQLPDWVIEALQEGVLTVEKDHLTVKTLEGSLVCNNNSWLIQGVEGELYPCDPDIFEKTYDKVED